MWVVLDDNTIRINGQCMDAGTATAIKLWPCNGTSAQLWQIGPNNTIVNALTGRCLDVPGGNPGTTTNPTQLHVAPCNPRSEQTWVLPQA